MTEIGTNLTPWVLGMVHESDEEILITDADADAERRSLTATLEEVIIHSSDDPSKPSQNLLDKVNAAIRKISSGTKTPSEGPSRKVSRNEERKRLVGILCCRVYFNDLRKGIHNKPSK